MATIQHVFITAQADPFHRMMKFVDGKMTIDAAFPQAPSPNTLGASAFSPDGKYLLAARVNTPTTGPFRMWRLDENMNWIALSLAQAGPLPLAGTISSVLWLSDTEVIATDSNTSGNAGIWMGVLDLSTHTITWTAFETATKGYLCAWVHSPGQFAASRLGNANQMWTKASGTWAKMTWSWQNTATARLVVNRPDLKLLFRFNYDTGAMVPLYISDDAAIYRSASTYASVGNGSRQIGITASTVVFSAAAVSPGGRQILYSHNEAPFLRTFTFTNPRKDVVFPIPLNIWFGEQVQVSPAFGGRLVGIEYITDNYVLVACESNNIGAGRVRAFYHDSKDETFIEDKTVSTAYNDFTRIITGMSAGPKMTAVAGSISIYNTALESLLKDTVNLANLKLLLLTGAAAFNPTHTTLAAAVGANEAFGGPWPQGGVACGSGSYPAGIDGLSYFSLLLPSVDYSDTTPLTFRSAIVYDDSDPGKKPLAFIDTGAVQTVSQLDRIKFSSGGNNILTFTPVN